MAKHYKITAPDANYTGQVGRVVFHRGTARVPASESITAELAYFNRRGYRVEVVEETPAAAPDKPVKAASRGPKASA